MALITVNIFDHSNIYLMSKKHIVYNFLINDRGLIHQSVNFPPGTTFLNPFEQEDESIDRTEKINYASFTIHGINFISYNFIFVI